tara:strand:- start:565 stop:1062 length:498 start_codon:yes stop_codon:yes gene_type:complete
MAENNLHFAELESKTDPTGFTTDTHLIVIRVVVVGKDVPTADGPLGDNPKHVDGETYCYDLFKDGIWKQTFKDDSLRKLYAGEGMVFDPIKDKFIAAQPYESWTIDENDDWQAPVPYPTILEHGDPVRECVIYWDDDGGQWESAFVEDPDTIFHWDASGLSWIAV